MNVSSHRVFNIIWGEKERDREIHRDREQNERHINWSIFHSFQFHIIISCQKRVEIKKQRTNDTQTAPNTTKREKKTKQTHTKHIKTKPHICIPNSLASCLPLKRFTCRISLTNWYSIRDKCSVKLMNSFFFLSYIFSVLVSYLSVYGVCVCRFVPLFRCWASHKYAPSLVHSHSEYCSPTPTNGKPTIYIYIYSNIVCVCECECAGQPTHKIAKKVKKHTSATQVWECNEFQARTCAHRRSHQPTCSPEEF